jgi:DNA-binding SARP family transcriptional activator
VTYDFFIEKNPMPIFDKVVESLLQEAIARGEFDNLKNKGKKLDLTDYFNTPEELRVAASVLKNSGVKPPEVELLREIAELKNQLASSQDNAKQAKLRERIQFLQIEFNIAMERIQQQRRKQ